jgi:hypothetical protein
MEKLVKCKTVSVKVSSSSDLEEEMIAHLSNGNEDAECLYRCRLLSEDPEGEEWVCCALCLMWTHTHALRADADKGTFVCERCFSK